MFYTKGKKFLKPFNVLAQEYSIKALKYTSELANGDVTLVTNFLEFINIFPNQQRSLLILVVHLGFQLTQNYFIVIQLQKVMEN